MHTPTPNPNLFASESIPTGRVCKLHFVYVGNAHVDCRYARTRGPD
jgi:hypothetical protein